ncbi:MAG: PHP domain-containing protein [Elusimicrobia bacterium]|nr:PHP domain-containing protein [Elusimicrobiota bacterium]
MIDLQLHTTDSDGTWPWDRVLQACLDLKLTAFSITDHDTVHRIDDIRAWAKAHNAQAIPGIELSTTENEQTVHLLGYFLDGNLDRLEERLRFLRDGRLVRNEQIIAKLRSLGVNVSEEDAKAIAGNKVVGRPHIARLLLNKGVVSSMQEAFDKYLAPGGRAYFPKVELPLRAAIELLHGAGAVTSVAHPALLKRTPLELENSLKEWRGWGLDGVEGIYPVYTPEQTGFFARMAQKYGFLITGGSDFHGENKPHIRIGVGSGSLNVPDALLEPLYRRRDEIAKAAAH